MSFVILTVLWLATLSIVIWTLKNGISPMPTSSKVKSALFKVAPHIESGVIYELGSGWGSLLVPLARHYTELKIIGFETSPVPYFVSKLVLKVLNVEKKRVKVLRKDFFKEDLSDASLIVCYLYPGAMESLSFKFKNELRQGTFVLSHTFSIPGFDPIEVVTVDDLYRTKIYLYKL